jgi:hypothetical protein
LGGRGFSMPVVKLSTDSIPIDQSGRLITRDSYSAFGEILSVNPMPQAAWQFDYGVNTRFISTTGTSGGGSVGAIESRGYVDTGTSPTGTAQMTAIKPVRHFPGFGVVSRFTAVFNTGIANSIQYIGLGDSDDGLYFGYDGVNFGVLRRRDNVESWIYQSDWNGDQVNFSPQLGNIYQIRYQWLGFGNIYFYIFDKAKRTFVNVHTIYYPNTSVSVHILNPTIKITARVQNTGNTSAIRLYSPSSTGVTEGVTRSQFTSPLDISNSYNANATYTDANKNHLLTIRNKSTLNGIPNRVPVRITSIDISRQGGATTAQTTIVQIHKNAVTAGALTFADIDTPNSPVEASATATTITSSSPRRTYLTSQNSTDKFIDLSDEAILVLPGESLSISIQDSGVQSTQVFGTINWAEEF